VIVTPFRTHRPVHASAIVPPSPQLFVWQAAPTTYGAAGGVEEEHAPVQALTIVPLHVPHVQEQVAPAV
jgi:hypothetical protein